MVEEREEEDAVKEDEVDAIHVLSSLLLCLAHSQPSRVKRRWQKRRATERPSPSSLLLPPSELLLLGSSVMLGFDGLLLLLLLLLL
jgi:hypothetical protein